MLSVCCFCAIVTNMQIQCEKRRVQAHPAINKRGTQRKLRLTNVQTGMVIVVHSVHNS